MDDIKETLKYIVTSRIRHSKITRANTEEVVDEYGIFINAVKKMHIEFILI